MTRPLHVLLLEDSPDDAELVVLQLKEEGFDPEWERVDTQAGFVAALAKSPDLILADYSLPKFNGLRALHLLKERGLDIPFILLSGTIGEDVAVEAIKQGAHDYLLKGSLTRLGSAVRNALEEKKLRDGKRAAEESLRASERRFRKLIENAPDAFTLLGADGRLKYISPSTERVMGYTAEEAIGSDPAEYTHPDDLPGLLTLLADLIQNPGQVVISQYRFRHKDGSWRWLESIITNLLAEPSINAIVFNFRDITERRQAGEALREAETRYRLLVERIPAITYVVAAQPPHKTLYVSPQIEQILGFTPEEWLTSPDIWERQIYPEDLERVLAEDRASREEHRPFICEYRIFTRDGRLIWLHDETYHIHEPGVPPFSQGIEFDITERKQRERELEAIATVSTALRTAQTLDEMLPRLLEETLTILGGSAGSIWFYDPASDEVLMAYQRGWDVTPVPIKRGEGVPGYVVASGQPYVSRELKTDPQVHEAARSLIPDGRGGACVPIRAADEVIGALYINTDLPHKFTEADVHLLTTLAEIAGSAIHRTRLHEQTARRLQQIASLHAIDLAISGSFDLQFTLNVLLEQLTNQLGVDAADVLLLDPYTHILEYSAGRGFRSNAIHLSKFRLGESLAGRAALDQHIISIPNLSESEIPFLRADILSVEKFIAYYGVPLIAKGKVKGVLEIFHRSSLTPDPDWLNFLETLVGQAAIAIDSATLFTNMQQANIELALAYDTTLEGWSRALDLRDKETEGHTQRVTEMTLKLARAIGMSEKELVHMRRGALLHDIGKMGVPDSILFNPGPLTDDEWAIMRQHPVHAYEMLLPISYLRPALDIPYCHHEKWDGSGYPRGLKGNEIPLAARIFAVVDVWDALRSDRPYRKGWSEKKVLKHIREQAGKHFDPQIVEVFLSLTNK